MSWVAMKRTCYTAGDMAEMLEHSIDWFYENRQRLHAAGMPAPIVPFGKLRFDRLSIDAWFGRHHPQAARTAPANDQAPLAVPAGTSEWQAHLAKAYGTN